MALREGIRECKARISNEAINPPSHKVLGVILVRSRYVAVGGENPSAPPKFSGHWTKNLGSARRRCHPERERLAGKIIDKATCAIRDARKIIRSRRQ